MFALSALLSVRTRIIASLMLCVNVLFGFLQQFDQPFEKFNQATVLDGVQLDSNFSHLFDLLPIAAAVALVNAEEPLSLQRGLRFLFFAFW